jgi:hypothetical protein
VSFLGDVRKLVHGAVLKFQEAPEYDGIDSLAELGRLQPRVHFDTARCPVDGWLSSAEQIALYSVARWTPGPILEIGPWLGRSTVTLALGIADSEKEKEFLTREVNPTLENFRPIGPEQMGFYLPADSTESMGVCSGESFERDIKPLVSRPGGVAVRLKENLERCGVSKRVCVSLGDFRELDARPYRLVFTDAMQDET